MDVMSAPINSLRAGQSIVQMRLPHGRVLQRRRLWARGTCIMAPRSVGRGFATCPRASTGRWSVVSRARFSWLCAALLIAVHGGTAAAASAVTEDVPLPGGTAALARALGIDPVPDR